MDGINPEAARCLIIPLAADIARHVHLPPEIGIPRSRFGSYFGSRERVAKIAAWELFQERAETEVPFETIPADPTQISLRRMVWWMRQYEAGVTSRPSGLGPIGWDKLAALNRNLVSEWLLGKNHYYNQNSYVAEDKLGEVTTIEPPFYKSDVCSGLLFAYWKNDIHPLLKSDSTVKNTRRSVARRLLDDIYTKNHVTSYQRRV